MGFRFRKRIKILRGVHVNVGKRGLSTSIGGKGVTLNVGGSRGAHLTAGVPGTGLSHTARLGGRSQVSQDEPQAAATAPVAVAATRRRSRSDAAWVSFIYITIIVGAALLMIISWVGLGQPISTWLSWCAVAVAIGCGAISARGTLRRYPRARSNAEPE